MSPEARRAGASAPEAREAARSGADEAGGEAARGWTPPSAEQPLYLDHHATTPVDPRVLEAMAPVFRDDFGNASSRTHAYGWRAEARVDLAREEIAAAIGASDPREIVFTSGATESDNLALQGSVAAARGPAHVVTSAIEHPAVLDTCRALAGRGVAVDVVPVDGEGRLDPEDVARAIRPETHLVSVMAANSEIGVLPPLAELGPLCAERGVLLHSDAAQAVGKIPLDVEALGIDLLAFSAHKIYGPKGIGALYVRRRRRDGGRRLELAPLLHGGGHERGLRAGTLAVPLIVGFARALALCLEEREAEARRLAGLRDRLLEQLRADPGGVRVNGDLERRLPVNLNLSFEGVEADALLTAVPELALSTGSACSSAHPEPSPVLRALGLEGPRLRGALRMGLGRGTREADVDYAARRLAEAVHALRARSGGSVASPGADR